MAGNCHEAGISSSPVSKKSKLPVFLPDRLEHLGRGLEAPLPDEVVPDRRGGTDTIGGRKLLDGRGVDLHRQEADVIELRFLTGIETKT